MDDGARLWMLKTVRAEFWRIAGWCDFEDVIQDGAVCYWTIRRRYPQAKSQPHIMALFKRAFRNHLTNLARSRTKHTLAAQAFNDSVGPDTCQDAEMARLITEAPTPLRRCLETIVANPDLLALPLRDRRESANEWLCRICGLESQDQMRLALRSYLAQN